MTNPSLPSDEEQYDSAEDEDFTLDQAGSDNDAELSSSSVDTDDEATGPVAKKRRLKKEVEAETGEIAELDSGDEAMIRKAEERKRRRKRKQNEKEKEREKGGGGSDDEDDDVDFDDEDEGEVGEGVGGFVRTRAMKMRIQEERRPLAKIDGATIDVDAVWAMMNAPDSRLGLAPSQVQKDEAVALTDSKTKNEDVEMGDAEKITDNAQLNQDRGRSTQQYPEEMVKIKRTYKFAGEMITEEKLVPKDSAEAKLFLSGAGAGGKDGEIVTVLTTDGEEANTGSSSRKLRRPLRRVSRFDPNPTGLIKRSWEKQPVSAEAGGPGQDENADVRGPKINTVEKSRLDWAAYVDQAGIKDELRVHSKAKEGFLGRMDFLDRVDAKREEERRNARLKGR